MLFGVLGPLAVGGDTAAVTAGRDRVLLAVLLLRAGRVVPVEDLIDAMWDADPPGTARSQLQSCVSRLRRLLPPDVLVTEPGGYRLAVGPGQLDLAEFRRLRAAGTVGEALALWRGPALPGIDSRTVRTAAAALDEERLAAVEEWADRALASGAADQVAAVVAPLVDQHPLRERLRELLMLALAAAGRRAEALDVFREGRQVLVDELGIEPGPALQALHRRLLDGTSDTAAAARALPRAVADFTGRETAVRQLVKEIEAAPAGAGVVQVIDGMGGSGKTTLAIHVANLVGDRYPDGHLYVDLHGHSERQPLDPAAALTTLLRQLGVRGELIPPDLDDRVALWRSELAGRHALVVLDNAFSTGQLRPLLPGGGDNLVLITSRRRLVGLDGVHPLSLPPLTEGEALDLLGRIIEPARVAAEPQAAADLVRRCGQLALAVRIAGSRLAHRRTWRIADLVHRLRDGHHLLAELTAEDRSVARVLHLSYDHIPPAAQRMLRAAGLHPGETFDALGAAALADVPAAEAVDLLDLLVDHHLLDEPATGRYRLHDLVRTFATTLAAGDPPEATGAAVERLLDHHLHATITVVGRALPVGQPSRPDLLADIVAGDERWLEAERPALEPLLRLAVAHGHHRRAGQLAEAQWRFLYNRGYYNDVIASQRIAITAAEVVGDRRALATAHNFLASAWFRFARYDRAITHLTRVIDLRGSLHDQTTPGYAEANLSSVLHQVGRWNEAIHHSRTAVERWRRSNATGVTCAHLNHGALLTSLGRYDEALRFLRLHLAVARDHHDLEAIGSSLSNLGLVRLRLGQLTMAGRLLRAACAVARRTGDTFVDAEASWRLGLVELAAGHVDEAERRQRRAVALMRQLSERHGEAEARSALGTTLLARGATDEARHEFTAVLDTVTTLRLPYEQAVALAGLGDVAAAQDEPDEAVAHWGQARETFQQLGAPEAAGVARKIMDHAPVPG